MQRPQKITLGEMRSSGPRRLLVYCADYRCTHHVAIDADRWPDQVRLSDLEPKFIYQACGRLGADVRPLSNRLEWEQADRCPGTASSIRMSQGFKTLRDAATYIMNLPASEKKKPHWQTAALVVLVAAEDRGSVMHASIGMLKALSHGEPPPTSAIAKARAAPRSRKASRRSPKSAR